MPSGGSRSLSRPRKESKHVHSAVTLTVEDPEAKAGIIPDEQASQTAGENKGKPLGTKPVGFLDKSSDHLRYFFLGFCISAGEVTVEGDAIGITLHVSQFSFLHELSIRYGIEYPSIFFPLDGGLSKEFKACKTGSVQLRLKDKAVDDHMNDYMRSTSNNTSADWLRSLFPTNITRQGRLEFLSLFILGIMAAAGRVDWTPRGLNPSEVRLHYRRVRIPCANLQLARWINAELQENGCTSAITHDDKRKLSSLHHCGRIHVQNSKENNGFFTTGLGLMRKHRIPACGTLKFLEDFLENDGWLPVSTLPARRYSFHQFLGESIHDHVASVVARDFFDQTLHSLENVLTFAGYNKSDIKDPFDFRLFVAFIKSFEAKKLSKRQRLLLDYINACEQRIIPNTEFGDVKRQKPFDFICPECSKPMMDKGRMNRHMLSHARSYYCSYRGCDSAFKLRCELQAHKREHFRKSSPKEQTVCEVKGCSEIIKAPVTQKGHNILYHSKVPNQKVSCPFDGCDLEFALKKDRASHIRSIHAPSTGLPKNFLCKAAGCNMRYTHAIQLKEHAKKEHDIELTLYSCPQAECDKQFTILASVPNHMIRVHKTKFPCNTCSKSLRTEGALQLHLQKCHNPDNQFVCSEPTCRRRYKTKYTCVSHEKTHFPKKQEESAAVS